jgi:hypothetical protein
MREAAARCLECGGYFCRECATEHDDRVICAACLKKLIGSAAGQKRGFSVVLRACQLFAGVFVLWIVFYFTGRMLLSMPNLFHDAMLSQFDRSESGE